MLGGADKNPYVELCLWSVPEAAANRPSALALAEERFVGDQVPGSLLILLIAGLLGTG